MTHTISEVEQILKSRGIFDVRATVIREFDDVIKPTRSSKGGSKRYRTYTQEQVDELTLLLAFRILGYSKSFSVDVVRGSSAANLSHRREDFATLFDYLETRLNDKTRA